MARTIADPIASSAVEPDTCLVFPSEVIAAFWRDEFLRLTGRQAVRADRFISWDTFKERLFRSTESRRPANRLYRTVFASAFLARNRRRPILRRLVDPAYAETAGSFERYIRSLLPGLQKLLRRGGPMLETVVGADLASDLKRLHGDYSQFLDLYGLFEPGWLEEREPVVDRKYLLFFTSVLDDFEQYASRLSALRSVTVVDTGNATPTATDLVEYANSVQETNALLDSIESLLEDGVHPRRIVVTLAAAAEYRPMLEREAALRSIPLVFRAGRPLSEYPPGRFLAELGRARARGFSVDALKSLCLNRAVPWREPARNSALVRFGINWNVAPAWVEAAGARHDGWLDAFYRAGAEGGNAASRAEVSESRTAVAASKSAAPASPPEATDSRAGATVSRAGVTDAGAETRDAAGRLRSYYLRLRSAVERVTGATSFRSMRDALYQFFEQFVDTSAWSDEMLPAFQSCMELLSDLVAAEGEISGSDGAGTVQSVPGRGNPHTPAGPEEGLAGINPYALWVSTLSDRVYVARSAEEGVSVYPYRVSAGLWPDYHFLLGMSHEATRVLFAHHPYLREDQKRKLEIEDLDLSTHFTELYLLSGKRVIASCSREVPSGTQLASGHFVRERAVVPANVDRPSPSLYRAETVCWETGNAALLPGRLYRSQKRGMAFQAGTGLSARGRDYVREVVQDVGLRELLLEPQRSPHRPDLIRLSTTHLEQFQRCAYAYHLSRALGVDEEPFELDFNGAVAFGNLYHLVLELLARDIRERTGLFEPGSAGEYREELARLIDRAAGRPRERTVLAADGMTVLPWVRPLYPPLAEVFRTAAHRLLPLLIEADLAFAPGHRLEAAEDWYSTELPDPAVELFGRIDRITSTPDEGGFTLVDYKKNRVPGKRAFERLMQGFPDEEAEEEPDGSERSASDERGSEGALDSGILQVPVYALLALSKRRDLDRAAYYSIEKGRYHVVFDRSGGRSMVDAGQLDHLIGIVRELVAATASRIRAGDYRAPAAEGGDRRCEGCPVRSVCRARYTVRSL
ncbi:PD-(D/E)XK nuclease family protein [Salinispira pacifica]